MSDRRGIQGIARRTLRQIERGGISEKQAVLAFSSRWGQDESTYGWSVCFPSYARALERFAVLKSAQVRDRRCAADGRRLSRAIISLASPGLVHLGKRETHTGAGASVPAIGNDKLGPGYGTVAAHLDPRSSACCFGLRVGGRERGIICIITSSHDGSSRTAGIARLDSRNEARQWSWRQDRSRCRRRHRGADGARKLGGVARTVQGRQRSLARKGQDRPEYPPAYRSARCALVGIRALLCETGSVAPPAILIHT